MTLLSRLNALNRNVAAAKSRANIIQDYDFLVTTTCPPSTAININGGKAWIDSNAWGYVYYVVQQPSDTLDFATATDIEWETDPTGLAAGDPFILSFSNPNYYISVALAINHNYIASGTGEQYEVYSDMVEYATASEAEEAIDAFLNGGIFGYSDLRLWTIVFRNNGVTDTQGAILPIDVINRGRSYLYRDIRGQLWIDG